MAQEAEKYLKYAFLATPYVTAISLLYLLGYWGTFRINIFNFISLTDILKLALIPSLYLVLCVAIGSTITYFMDSWIISKGKPPPQPIKPKGHFILNCLLASAALLVLIFVSGSDKWMWAGLISGSLLTRVLENLEVSKQLIPNRNLRFCIILLVSIPLTAAYGFGRQRAEPILTGKSTLIETRLFRENESLIKKGLLEHEKLKFIGIAGEYLFFLTVDNSRVYVVKFSDLHFLEFDPWN